MKKNTQSALVLLTIALTLLACENPDDNSIEKIRSCVDGASRTAISDAPTAANIASSSCQPLADASTFQGKELVQIKFGIVLLKEQKLAQIAQMASGLSNKTSANHDGLNNAIAIMVFSAGANPTIDASNIQGYGNTLGGAAQTLGNMILLATTLNSLGTIAGNADSAYANLHSCATGGCLPAQLATIAQSALSMESSACSSAADQNSTDPTNLCFKMKAAIGNATTNAQIVTNLDNYASTSH